MRRVARGAVAMLAVATLLTPSGPLFAYPRPGVTERISTPPGGRGPQPPGGLFSVISEFPSPSSDGRYVAFSSSADDLVRNDDNRMTDIFVHDRKTRRVAIVSVTSDGTASRGIPLQSGFIPGAGTSSLSGTGRFVAFSSAAINLVAGDSNFQTDVFVHDRATGRTERVSVASNGNQGNGPSIFPSISLDGRFVAFESRATNLVRRDSNDDSDIFLHDRRTGRTERVSVSSNEAQADGASHCASLGRSGRHLVFTSYAENLAPTPGGVQVYLRDRKRGTTELVSEPPAGPEPRPSQQGSQACPLGGRSLSADGRVVVFESHMPDFVPNDSNGVVPGISVEDVFVVDRKIDEVARVSVTSAGEEVDRNSFDATVSPDGRYVSFAGFADDLSSEQPPDAPGPLSGDEDVFIHDRKTGITGWISKGLRGAAARTDTGFTTSRFPAVSGGGRVVTFFSNADNLVSAPNVAGSLGEVFVRYRGIDQGVAHLVAFGRADPLSVAEDHRFAATGVADVSAINRLASDVTPGLRAARVIYRPSLGDIFVRLHLRDVYTGAAFTARSAGIVYGLSFKVDGRPYELRAAVVGTGASAPLRPAFGLFSCDGSGPCEEVTKLAGGFGTTGNEIVAAIPLARLGVKQGSVLSEMLAYASLGTYEGGPAGR